MAYGGESLVFDAENRLVQVGSGSIFTAGYTSDDMRAWKKKVRRLLATKEKQERVQTRLEGGLERSHRVAAPVK